MLCRIGAIAMALAATGGLFYWHGKKQGAGTQRVEAVPTLLQPG